MPPKKDAKKGGAAKELDPSLYVRKVRLARMWLPEQLF